VNRRAWGAAAAVALLALPYGGWSLGRAYPAPQVAAVFDLAGIKCHPNGGLRHLQQRGISPTRYDFACNNDAQFIGVETNFAPPTPVAMKDFVGQAAQTRTPSNGQR
jgi:hypothetical protein